MSPRILSAVELREPQAAEQLLPLVHRDLRQPATHKLLQEKPGQILQATALVHEADPRLVNTDKVETGHFFAAAADVMRRILIESARLERSLKAGGRCPRLDLSGLEPAVTWPDVDLLSREEGPG